MTDTLTPATRYQFAAWMMMSAGLLLVLYLLSCKLRVAPVDVECLQSLSSWLMGFLIIDFTIEALEIVAPDRFTIDLVDVFKQYAPPPLNLAPAAYPGMVRVPQMWGFGYRMTNGQPRARAITGAAWPYIRRAVRRLAREQRADQIVSVHPVMITAVIKGYGSERPPFLTIVTDLVTTHALWYDRRVDQYVVPTESARERALACRRYG